MAINSINQNCEMLWIVSLHLSSFVHLWPLTCVTLVTMTHSVSNDKFQDTTDGHMQAIAVATKASSVARSVKLRNFDPG